MKQLSNKTKPKILKFRHITGKCGYGWDNGALVFDKPGRKDDVVEIKAR